MRHFWRIWKHSVVCPGSITNGRYAYLSRQANLKFATAYINKRVEKINTHAQSMERLYRLQTRLRGIICVRTVGCYQDDDSWKM